MDLRLSAEQDQLVDAFRSLYAKHAPPDRVRDAELVGHDPELWSQLQGLGVIEMAIDEDRGGWGASMLDLALVAEQHGRHVAPAPLIERQVAARALARLESPRLDDVLSGDRVTSIALHPSVDGVAPAVPAASVADDVLVLVGDALCLVPVSAGSAFENLGSMPLADVGTDGGEVLEGGAVARQVFETALDEWLLLTAAALVGLGARALEIGVEYARERIAFGVPIGSFQALSHPFADSAAALDGARLLAYEAAWAVDEDTDRARELAALAFAFGSESARDASYRSLHVHGGYGFMLEYDIQLYWRRARAWPAVWGAPPDGYRRAADARHGRR